MTLKELGKVGFKMTEHLAMADCHIMICESVNFHPKIIMRIETPVGDSDAKKVQEFLFNGEWYDTPRKLLYAINKNFDKMKKQ